MNRSINSARLMPPTARSSHCVVVEGSRFIFISGQVPVDAEGNLVPQGDIGEHAGQVLRNLISALESAQAPPEDLVNGTMFVTNVDADQSVTRVREDLFGEQDPASTKVAVTPLADPAWLLEVEPVAIID